MHAASASLIDDAQVVRPGEVGAADYRLGLPLDAFGALVSAASELIG